VNRLDLRDVMIGAVSAIACYLPPALLGVDEEGKTFAVLILAVRGQFTAASAAVDGSWRSPLTLA
jgi:hypothetical protein